MARKQAELYDCMICDPEPCKCNIKRKHIKVDLSVIENKPIEEVVLPESQKRKEKSVELKPEPVKKLIAGLESAPTVTIEAPVASGLTEIKESQELVEFSRALLVLAESGLVMWEDLAQHVSELGLPRTDARSLIWRIATQQYQDRKRNKEVIHE